MLLCDVNYLIIKWMYCVISYFNVMGLPIQKLYRELKQL